MQQGGNHSLSAELTVSKGERAVRGESSCWGQCCKVRKIKAGKLDEDCRILAQVRCPSEVDSKGRLRKHGDRLICPCIDRKPKEKGLNWRDRKRESGAQSLLHRDKQKIKALTLSACSSFPHCLKPLQRIILVCVVGERNYKIISKKKISKVCS